MNITLKRVAKKSSYTIGKMYINGTYFCDTLEDTDRGIANNMSSTLIKSKKVYSKTAIPTGTYKIVLNVSPKFKRILPRLIDVPGFDGVLIHRGNTAEDTAGCILVGENKVVGKVINSTQYELKIVKLIQQALDRHESITISIY